MTTLGDHKLIVSHAGDVAEGPKFPAGHASFDTQSRRVSRTALGDHMTFATHAEHLAEGTTLSAGHVWDAIQTVFASRSTTAPATIEHAMPRISPSPGPKTRSLGQMRTDTHAVCAERATQDDRPDQRIRASTQSARVGPANVRSTS